MNLKRTLAAALAALTIISSQTPVEAHASGIDWGRYSCTYFSDHMGKRSRKLYKDVSAQAQKIMKSGADYKQITVKYKDLTNSEVTDVLKVWKQTEAQYFFTGDDYGYRYDYKKGKKSDRHSGKAIITIDKRYQSGSARRKAKRTFKRNIDAILKKASEGETQIEKERIVHDALDKRLTWDDSDYKSKQSSASSLIRKETVCAGYAAAFSVLMNAQGIPTISVTSPHHEWNEIYLDNNWYNVDVTFDDPIANNETNNYPDGENIIYNYFNISDSTLKSMDNKHNIESYWDKNKRPECRGDYEMEQDDDDDWLADEE